MRKLSFIAVVLLAVSCAAPSSQQPGSKSPPVTGQDQFTSAAQSGSNGSKNASAADGAANAPGTSSQTRTVEEGDVYKLVGNELYILNQYRGLQMVDVTDPDHPIKQGTSHVYGYPIEMYVRDGYAYVIVSDYFTYWQAQDSGAQPFHGSEVRIVDVKDPNAPVVVGGIDLDGAISDTRIVGDVLYVVANRWAWYTNPGSTDTTDSLEVSSIDLSNPAAPLLAQQLSFPGSSNVIHVSPTTLYVASPGQDWQNPTTTVTVVDISDPHGALATTGTINVPGYVEQRYQLDEYDGTFRIVTHTGSWGSDGAQTLSVFQLSPQISLLSTLSLPSSGELSATRFDGDRCYLVTQVSVDPLDVVDLRDPANPVLTQSVQVPGLIQQIAPEGNRLLTLGTDQRWSNVAASLFDVTDPQNVKLLSRVKVGVGTTWSNANWDDKALQVLPDQGLMLVPFSGYLGDVASPDQTYVNGFQILSFDQQTLAARGVVQQDGEVMRTVPDANRIFSLSDRVLQTVDATDLDHPTVTAKVELARDVSDFAIIGNHAVTLSTSGWWWDTTTTELRVATLDKPDDSVIGKLTLPFQGTKLLVDGSDALVLGNPDPSSGTQTAQLFAARVDLSNPAAPKLIGSPLAIPDGPTNGTDYLWAYAPDAVLAGSGVVVLPAWGSRQISQNQWESLSVLIVADLVHGSVARLELPGEMAGDLIVQDGELWTTDEEVENPSAQNPVARYYADRIDLSNPTAPRLAAKLNIPGTLVGTADNGTTLYTRDYRWTADDHVQHALAELVVSGGFAHLRKYLLLDQGLGQILADGHRLYATTETWWWDVPSGQSPTASLRVYESSASQPLHEVSRIPVDVYLQARALAGGHLFLGTGFYGMPWEFGVAGGAMANGGGAAPSGASGGAAVGNGVDMPYFGPTEGLVDYSLADADHPAFRQFVRTNGWVQGLAVDAGRLYVSGGIYGIESVALTP